MPLHVVHGLGSGFTIFEAKYMPDSRCLINKFLVVRGLQRISGMLRSYSS